MERLEIGTMSELGQKRRFDRRLVTSGLPGSTDIRRARRHVSKVPMRLVPLPPPCSTDVAYLSSG